MQITVTVSHVGKADPRNSWREGEARVRLAEHEGTLWVHVHIPPELHVYLDAAEAGALGDALIRQAREARRGT